MRASTILLAIATSLTACTETGDLFRDIVLGPSGPAGTEPAPAPDPAPPEPTNEPLIAYTWFPLQTEGYGNIFHPPVVRSWMSADHIVNTMGLRELPPGYRVIRPFATEKDHKLHEHPQDVPPWTDHGVASLRDWWEPLLDDLVQQGIVLDGVLLDDEERPVYWNRKVRDRFDEVMASPRREELFARLGIRDLNMMHEHRTNAASREAVRKFNSVMIDYFQRSVEKAYEEPLRRRFPNAWISNYSNAKISPNYFVAPDLNGWYPYQDSEPVGSRAQTAAYPCNTGHIFTRPATNPTGARRPWGATFLHALLLEANSAVSVLQNPENRPLQLWLPTAEFEGIFDAFAHELPGVSAMDLWRAWCTWMIYRHVPDEVAWFNRHRDHRQPQQERELSELLDKFTRMGIVGARPLEAEPHPWDADRVTCGFINQRGEVFTCTIDAQGRITESRGR